MSLPARANNSKASKHVPNLNGLRVTLCCEPDARHGDYVRALQRQRMEVTSIWPPPAGRLAADMDVLICEYFPEMADLIPWVLGDATSALIVILPQNGRYDDSKLIACAPQAVLQRPFSDSLVATTVRIAWSQFRYDRRLLDRVKKLDENVRTLRDVERAKLIIMTQKNVDADAAYRHLRETAMNSQLPVSALARTIIEASQIETQRART